MPNEEILERERERVRVEYEQVPIFLFIIFLKSQLLFIYYSKNYLCSSWKLYGIAFKETITSHQNLKNEKMLRS